MHEVGKLAHRDPNAATRRLFDFSVVDPAMGSAHFLTAALDMVADRIEIFLAEAGGLPGMDSQFEELREDTGPVAYQVEDGDLLRRLILKRCIYGVDLSPMAVEVANVTLWLASFVPGLALSYLGSNLKCGDALIGVADPHVVGGSDSPLLTGLPVRRAMERAADLQRQLAENPDRNPNEVKSLGRTRRRSPRSHRWTPIRLRLVGGRTVGTGRCAMLETTRTAKLRGAIARRRPSMQPATLSRSLRASPLGYRFFHWPLEFPSRLSPRASWALTWWSAIRRGTRSPSKSCAASWRCT